MAFRARKWKRRLGRLLDPSMWSLGFWSLLAALRLAGFREGDSLEKIAGPWEAERGRLAGRPLREGDLSLPRFVAGLPFFFYPLFPKTCLRRSLVLYRHLVRLGLDPELWVGVRKDGSELAGHAWVLLEGKPAGEKEEFLRAFSPILVLRRGRTTPAEKRKPGPGNPESDV